MIEAIIFDMDGILVDSEPVWNEARVQLAKSLGKTWTSHDHEAVMGVSTSEWVDYMMQRLEPAMTPKELEEEIVKNMAALYEKQIPFMPHAVETVNLAKNLCPIGLASGSVRKLIDTVTQSPELRDKFEVILSADQVARGKPHPDVYLKTAELMNVDPKHCICIEDSGNGVLAGKAAGMRVIAVPDERFPPVRGKLEQADIILNSLSEIDTDLLTLLV